MPMYDYYCFVCAIEYEIFVKDKDTMISCPKCEAELKRMPSAPSFYVH